MCRNIKTLANFEPAATEDEVRASALQFVRKLSGTTRPSRANEQVFERAVDEVTAAARRLIQSLETSAPRAIETTKNERRGSGRNSASPRQSAVARADYCAVASAFTASDSFWTFAPSLEPLASPSICDASCVSALLRAAPDAFSAPFSDARTAAIRSVARPCDRSS